MTAFVFGTFDLLGIYRKAPRYPVRLDCQVRINDGVVAGRIINISRKGCQIRMKAGHVLGTKSNLSVNIQLGDQLERIEAGIENVWSCRQGKMIFHGVRFDGMCVECDEILAKYIERLKEVQTEKVRGLAWAGR